MIFIKNKFGYIDDNLKSGSYNVVLPDLSYFTFNMKAQDLIKSLFFKTYNITDNEYNQMFNYINMNSSTFDYDKQMLVQHNILNIIHIILGYANANNIDINNDNISKIFNNNIIIKDNNVGIRLFTNDRITLHTGVEINIDDNSRLGIYINKNFNVENKFVENDEDVILTLTNTSIEKEIYILDIISEVKFLLLSTDRLIYA